MNVLIWTGIDFVTTEGGHRIQMAQTAAHLSRLGVKVVSSSEAAVDLQGIDVVHGCFLPPPQIRLARQAGLPVVLSTIHWSKAYTSGQLSVPTLARQFGRLRLGAALMLSSLRGRAQDKCEALVRADIWRRQAFECADLLLPNSTLEARQIAADLGVSTPVFVVPNAVDPSTFALPDRSERPIDVLFVGRFEPHKNQLGLIRALAMTQLKVVLIGPAHQDHPQYMKSCLKEAGPHMEIRPAVPHEELVHLYQTSKVHALPSGFETTGLVSLEAALCGCRIVSTRHGYASEYFEDMAWYCNPLSPASIRQAVLSALAAPTPAGLIPRILSRYTWAETARLTLAAYQTVLRQAPGGR